VLIREIALYLANQGVGTFNETSSGGTIFLGFVPTSPDQVLTLFDTPGPPASGTLPYDTPSFQVRVRGTQDVRTAYNKALQVYGALHGLHHTTLPGGTWLLKCLGMQSGPVGIGVDDNGRHIYVVNFTTEIHKPSTHRED
jgi:hypothetical protein